MTPAPVTPPFDAAELTALAHLYRGEMNQATVWRCRLDATTNWAVITTGVAFSATFANAANPAWPLLMLVAMLVFFLGIEARRYRYFDIWRTRVRVLEHCWFVPMLRRTAAPAGWNDVLADDYERMRFHISGWEAFGRRYRRNYAGAFLLQAVGFLGKLALHPTPAGDAAELLERAAFGAIPGAWVLAGLALVHGTFLTIALVTLRGAQAVDRLHPRALRKDDPMLVLAGAGAPRPANSPP